MSACCPGCGTDMAGITHVCPPVETRSAPVTINPTLDAMLREALVQAVNGWPISPDLAWGILRRWDESKPPEPQP